MKQVIASIVLLWCIVTTAVAKAEGPVLKVRVLKQRVCLIGKDCQPIEIACGSAVVVDHAVGKKTGAKGYALLTAAHVVSDREKLTPQGRSWVLYPQDCWLEVLIGGEWQPAKLHFTSKNADLAILTVGSSATVEMVCLAQERPKVNESLSITGWTECTTLDTYNAKVEIWDMGPNCADSFHKATGPVVSGQSGGAVFNSQGDLVGILTARDSKNNRIGIYTNQPEILRFMKAAWNPDLQTKPEIDSKAPSIAPEATEPKDVPKVIQPPPKPPEAKPSGSGGIWEGAGEEPLPQDAPLPKEEPKNLLPTPPKLPDFPEILGGMGKKAPVADAIVKAEPFFKLGSLALTGLQLAGIAVPGVGLPVAGAAGVIMWLARKRKSQVENGNGVPPLIDTTDPRRSWDAAKAPVVKRWDLPPSVTTGPKGSWYGYADPKERPPEPPPAPTGPPKEMPDWLKNWQPQVVVQPAPVTVVTNEKECPRPGGAGIPEPPRANLPLPRDLDETRQLLELLQANGSVPALEALAGTLYKAEIEKLLHEGVSPEAERVLSGLVSTVLQRVNDIAPISTKD